MSLRLTWLASIEEPRASSSLSLAIPPPPLKASFQSKQCVTSNRWRLVKALATVLNHIPSYYWLNLFCFFGQITVHKGEECALLNNSQPYKWKVLNQSGNEATVPSVCFIVPPVNKEAVESVSK